LAVQTAAESSLRIRRLVSRLVAEQDCTSQARQTYPSFADEHLVQVIMGIIQSFRRLEVPMRTTHWETLHFIGITSPASSKTVQQALDWIGNCRISCKADCLHFDLFVIITEAYSYLDMASALESYWQD
jgi:hypothetical protein